ncbi:hypothetical protein SCE1572_41570 [Sorangium cellulosum So0157-2]|uniref:Uncharacterized protein n=1 Tax=Sorangium cellulosum So0157-2 TaxID=1254432 RepID=S4Y4T8_SORCE|nr:hypothetical protein SCE1572_41570 [Sorangium cellulosum So0157-2]
MAEVGVDSARAGRLSLAVLGQEVECCQLFVARVLKHPGLARPTPVFSATLPPRGASGALRRVPTRSRTTSSPTRSC